MAVAAAAAVFWIFRWYCYLLLNIYFMCVSCWHVCMCITCMPWKLEQNVGSPGVTLQTGVSQHVYASLSLGWPDVCGGGNRTSLTLNPNLVCFLLGELVGFLPTPLPHKEVAASFLPCKEPCRTFHTSYSGMGLVCVCGTQMCSATALWTALE